MLNFFNFFQKSIDKYVLKAYNIYIERRKYSEKKRLDKTS